MTGRPSVLFLTSGRRVPSSRFRVLPYVRKLVEEGFRVRVAPCVPQKYATHFDYRFGGQPLAAALAGAKLIGRVSAILRAPFYDLVYIERELLPAYTPLLEEMTFGLNRRIVFDFDDAIHLKYDLQETHPIARVCRLAKLVIAGNEFLAQFARLHARRVAVVPTPIDTDRFRPLGDASHLMWTGSQENLRSLRPLFPILSKYPLRVLANRRPEFPCEFVPWSEEAETQLSGIGLMPLPDDEWSKGKCGFKLLQYMACGMASIASPVGVNPEILGDAGLLARTPEEWGAAIERLQDPALRRELGARARTRAVELYSVRAIFPRWRAALLSALD